MNQKFTIYKRFNVFFLSMSFPRHTPLVQSLSHSFVVPLAAFGPGAYLLHWSKSPAVASEGPNQRRTAVRPDRLDIRR